MKHITELEVRHYECDEYGHVNNAVYMNYLEFAREQFLKAAGFDYKGYIKAGYGLLVVKVTINYREPALPEDMLVIETEPLKRRRSSGIFFQTIKRDETIICDAEVTWASVDSDGKLCAIPSDWDSEGLYPPEK